MKRRSSSHILITAQSNSACDEVATRLLKYISRTKMMRIYSPSVELKTTDIDPELRSISNLRNKQNIYPSYEELYHFNIVVTTLVSCSRLVQANIKRDHFDYIFIDECAASIEPECLIPIIGESS